MVVSFFTVCWPFLRSIFPLSSYFIHGFLFPQEPHYVAEYFVTLYIQNKEIYQHVILLLTQIKQNKRNAFVHAPRLQTVCTVVQKACKKKKMVVVKWENTTNTINYRCTKTWTKEKSVASLARKCVCKLCLKVMLHTFFCDSKSKSSHWQTGQKRDISKPVKACH